MSCGFLLCLGLSNAAQADNAVSAADEMKADQSDRTQGDQMSDETQGGKKIKGEVLRVEGDNCFVKGQDGKEIRLHIDQTTEMSERVLTQGDLIEVMVNDQNHALSIRSPDRRNDHTTDATPESEESGQPVR